MVTELNIKLTEREKTILRIVIQDFIKTAKPVGSRQIWKKYNLPISPATIRNTMADLEEMGLLTHPHTSAGRVPTDLGYRVYVDSLMQIPDLTKAEKKKISAVLPECRRDIESLLEKTARLLSQVSRNLGIILAPTFDSGTLKRIEISSLSSDKILVVVEVDSGLVKTVVMEITYSIKPSLIPEVARLLNERLSGLTLREIQDTIHERCKDMLAENSLIRLIIDEASELFSFSRHHSVTLHGAQWMLKKPEFSSLDRVAQIVNIIENGNIIAHLFEDENFDSGIIIRIGSENADAGMGDFSLVASKYDLGNAKGKIAVIGPKRMNYPKAVAVVGYTAESINLLYKDKNED